MVDYSPKAQGEGGSQDKIRAQQHPNVPVSAEDRQPNEEQTDRQQHAGRLNMVQPGPQEQVVNVILVRFERRAVLFDTCDTYAEGVEDRHRQYAYCHSRSSAHMVYLGNDMVRVLLAETKDKRGNKVPQQQASGVSHENLPLLPNTL